MASERTTNAAGGIVWRNRSARGRPETRLEVLVVHRPSYDDWTFPKGKVDPGETLQETAVREIAEETGTRVRLGHPLPQIRYPISGGTKRVSYWCARLSTDEVGKPFRPNREVDEIRWVSARDASKLLTYVHDVSLLDAFAALRDKQAHRSRTLIVLRHAKAVDRAGFDGTDLDRPLTTAGTARAASLVPQLSAYGMHRIVSSPAIRCVQTVDPYAHAISMFLEVDDRLAEGTHAGEVRRSVMALLDRKKPVVLCTHRPTLRAVFETIGIPVQDLAPGEGVVVHHRKGIVLALETLA
ncbi:NUDIX hydrolase [Aeromicrobium sp.]|uniref:NUDIX hydrolase n=1 Tax=Aeromicrobium sp. TaxID=1871063 RepID=UPI001993413A|nr:NUDIX hydrolase [Aeromicrobium sp.]MBC7630205.1 NUDIX hydrolase [Aeromicrobium sp.]